MRVRGISLTRSDSAILASACNDVGRMLGSGGGDDSGFWRYYEIAGSAEPAGRAAWLWMDLGQVNYRTSVRRRDRHSLLKPAAAGS
jgi:hypothetical protein